MDIFVWGTEGNMAMRNFAWEGVGEWQSEVEKDNLNKLILDRNTASYNSNISLRDF